MGWSYSCTPGRLKEFLEKRKSGWEYSNPDSMVTAKTVCLTAKYVMYNPGAGTLWKVMETTGYTRHGGVTTGPERWIAVDLVRCVNRCWGYKDMEAGSGPNEINCPLKYLEMVPEPLPCKKTDCTGCSRCYERGWREKVRAKHAIDAKRKQFIRGLQVGDVIVIAPGYTIASGKQVTVERLKPLLAGNFNLKPKHIDVEASLAAVGIDKEAV